MKKFILAFVVYKNDGSMKLKGVELRNRSFAIIDREAKNIIPGTWYCEVLKTIDDKKQDKVDILYPVRKANLSDGKLVNDRCTFRLYKDGLYVIKTLNDVETNMRIGKAYYKVLSFDEEFKYYKDFSYSKEEEYEDFEECIKNYMNKIIHNAHWWEEKTNEMIAKRGIKGTKSKKVPVFWYDEKQALLSGQPYHEVKKSDVDHPMESDFYTIYESDTLTNDEIIYEWDYSNDVIKFKEEIEFFNKYFKEEKLSNQFMSLVTYGEEDYLK